MSKFPKKILRNKLTNRLVENFLYEDGITERIHPKLEEDLRNNKHSLAECDVFPEGDVITSEMKLIRERFKEVVHRCRDAFDVDKINDNEMKAQQMPLVYKAMDLEGPHLKELEELAIRMVMEEFDMDEDDVLLEAKLTPNVNLSGASIKPGNEDVSEAFNDHDEIIEANAQVKKRRVLNAMTQGAATKVNHMFHMVNGELSELNPRLPHNYKKIMSSADYLYFIAPDINGESTAAGGSCSVDFDGDEGDDRPVIRVEAIIFPVLIHELVKGVMEVLSAHGLPTQKNIAEYVIDKADFMGAEPWDMRLGPPMWSRLCEAIPEEDFGLKHYVYADIAKLPPHEFNMTMKEILAQTMKGKQIILEILTEVKDELKDDEFNESMGDDYFNIEDLL